jgi:hypothetical protein
MVFGSPPGPAHCPLVAAALIIVGVSLELAGLAMVALDVRQSRRDVERMSRQDVLVQAPAAAAKAQGFPPMLHGGEMDAVPLLEERVAILEREVERLQHDLVAIEDRETAAHRELTARFAEWIAEARRETFELGQQLRPMIGRVAAGNVRRRASGVGLFAAGLIVQTAGNLMAL